MALPGQPRTSQASNAQYFVTLPRSLCVVTDQGTERAVVKIVMNDVAGARRTPGRHKTGGVPPKPPATIHLSLSLLPSVFWDFGSLNQTRCGVILASCCGCTDVAASLVPTAAAAAFRLDLDVAASLMSAVAAAATTHQSLRVNVTPSSLELQDHGGVAPHWS